MMSKKLKLSTINKTNKNTLMESLKIEFTDVGDDYLVAKMPVKNTFKHYAKKVLNLVKDKILVGHNVEYDYRVLKNELKSCKINYNSKTICTIEMARKSYKDLKYYNLNFLCNYFDIELVNHHRALDDATATLNLFKKLKG